jgi:hypothetical protein
MQVPGRVGRLLPLLGRRRQLRGLGARQQPAHVAQRAGNAGGGADQCVRALSTAPKGARVYFELLRVG